jgi:hypothetical protein
MKSVNLEGGMDQHARDAGLFNLVDRERAQL